MEFHRAAVECCPSDTAAHWEKLGRLPSTEFDLIDTGIHGGKHVPAERTPTFRVYQYSNADGRVKHSKLLHKWVHLSEMIHYKWLP
jgi:hypothetical protein